MTGLKIELVKVNLSWIETVPLSTLQGAYLK